MAVFVFNCRKVNFMGILWTITLIFLFQLVQVYKNHIVPRYESLNSNISIAKADLPAANRPCAPRVYGINKNNIVCVCNATYCDDIQPLTSIQNGTAVVYVSSMAGKRFERSTVPIGTVVQNAPGTIKVVIDARQKFQSIIGFGGAFTDAAGINIASLGKQTQQNLLESYFGTNVEYQKCIEYNLGRVPIASCDFSTREYSYAEVDGDFQMDHFALAKEDFEYKIPHILSALNLTHGNLRLFASPWSAPGWMKRNGRMKGGGPMKGNVNGPYYQAFSKYFVRFFEEYSKNGIKFWGLTIENEPIVGGIPHFPWQSMYFSAEMERDYLKGSLGPTLKANKVTKDLKVMIYDESRTSLPNWAYTVYNDKQARSYADGMGVHWYMDRAISPSVLSSVYQRHPDKFILATEACTGAMVHRGPILGDWSRAEEYAKDIIEDLNHYVAGWTDWNLCLNEKGGPNWVSNFVDSPIIVNAKADEFYKQPMFYAMGHFSKFIKADALRIATNIKGVGDIQATATVHQGRTTLVMMNKYDLRHSVTINDMEVDRRIALTMEPRSIATIIWDK